MLFDGLFTIGLPYQQGPALPTPWWEQLENLLFGGYRLHRSRECQLSGGSVLARCYGVLSGLQLQSFEVKTGTEVVFSRKVVPDQIGQPPIWAEALPPRWEREPIDFLLSARWDGEGVRGVLLIQYVPNGQAALVGSLRLIWDAVAVEDPDAFSRSLHASLPDPSYLRVLAGRLEQLGEYRLEQLTRLLSEQGGAFSGEVLMLEESPDKYPELLSGFEASELAALPWLRKQAVVGDWVALKAAGVRGELHHGVWR
jgi:hypothetical protein